MLTRGHIPYPDENLSKLEKRTLSQISQFESLFVVGVAVHLSHVENGLSRHVVIDPTQTSQDIKQQILMSVEKITTRSSKA